MAKFGSTADDYVVESQDSDQYQWSARFNPSDFVQLNVVMSLLLAHDGGLLMTQPANIVPFLSL
jgi:hypothetical protein